MTEDQIRQILNDHREGKLSGDDALDRLRKFPFEDLGFANVDHHRSLRQGHPEVIFCEGKTVEQVGAIAERLVAASGGFLGTRATPEQAAALEARFPELQWNPLGRTVYLPSPAAVSSPGTGDLLIVSAGTSDLPVAEEAAATATAFGLCVGRLTDIGVAGIHRLLNQSRRLAQADAVIVVAGMEGALPSVVGGMVSVPVIAVPTSVGYGASFGGLAALLAMLNSCAAGVTVVNIDNGFGAAVAASRILHKRPLSA